MASRSNLVRTIQPLLVCVFLSAASQTFAAEPAGQEEEAVRVYKQLKPSVVSLKNAEGSGTGILIQPDLILTNAHVVSSPLPFEVRIDADAASGKTAPPLVFKKVQIAGYHPQLDLALVRIDPKEAHGAVLKTATLSKTKGEPGQRVYVIGDPAGGGGKVLTKTITSGMLSAVDREVEGEKYYQTDAAINPGNSGGPMCDRSGKVLGLVTFKFTDVQAIGFAIPLHDLNVKSFVPLTQRKADPKLAKELLEEAEKYAGLGERAEKREGHDSPNAAMFNYYAALCYRMALAHDPANHDIYYMVGMLLRSLDEDSVGAAYLARAVQLQPWLTANYYRELGLSLAKQNKNDEALAAWTEGVTKFPYAAKIWEDLSIYYIQHNRPTDAARSASTTLLISEKDTRIDMMKQVVKDARAKVSGSAAGALDEQTRTSYLVPMLDRMLAASNAARKTKKVFVNKPCADLIAGFGGTTPPDIDKRIPSEPASRLPELARLDGGAASASAGKSAGPDASSGDWITKDASSDAKPAGDKPSSETVRKTKSTKKGKPADSATAKTGPDAGDWIGPGGGKSAATSGPKPTVTGEKLAGNVHTVVDARVTPLEVKNVADAVFSADGKFLFVVQTDGIVRKIAVPEMTEERRLEVGSKCNGIGRCKLGPVVAVEGLQEVWLLDEQLEVKKRATATGLTKMAASPALSLVFATGGEDRLSILDMAAGRAVAQLSAGDFAEQRGVPQEARGLGFRHPAASADGNYLFFEGSECIHRLRITGNRLVYEEGGPRIGANPQDLVISPDSRYVALPSGGGNSGIEGQPRKPYATYVFRCTDLKTPVMTIESGAYPQTLGFDLAAHSLYAQNHDKQLMVYTPSGLKGKEYKIDRSHSSKRFYVHPQGKKLFMLTDEGLSWVELP